MKTMTLTEAREVAQQINEIIRNAEQRGVYVFAVDADRCVGHARCFVVPDKNTPENQPALGIYPYMSLDRHLHKIPEKR